MDRVDRYVIEAELGSGAFGAVYRARHELLQRVVALKVLHANRGLDRDRFLQEATALARLQHPNIVEVHDAGVTPEGKAFLALEMLEGETLSSRLRRGGAFPPQEALWVACSVLSALAASHRAGIVHRDIKHPNIFLAATSRGPEVKVLDFGVARVVGNGVHTATGLVIGTPRYIAPEIFRGATASAQSDLWSTAVVLYELLLGKHAHPGQGDEVIAAIVDRPPRPIRERDPAIPQVLANVLERALAMDPSARFSDADSFRAALEQRQTPQPTIRQTVAVEVALGTVGEEPEALEPSQAPTVYAKPPPPTRTAAQPKRRWPWVAVAATAALVVAGSTTVLVLDQLTEPARPEPTAPLPVLHADAPDQLIVPPEKPPEQLAETLTPRSEEPPDEPPEPSPEQPPEQPPEHRERRTPEGSSRMQSAMPPERAAMMEVAQRRPTATEISRERQQTLAQGPITCVGSRQISREVRRRLLNAQLPRDFTVEIHLIRGRAQLIHARGPPGSRFGAALRGLGSEHSGVILCRRGLVSPSAPSSITHNAR
ncbi:MAG: serine/threonine-protein kinase [Myxococcota bacterium]